MPPAPQCLCPSDIKPGSAVPPADCVGGSIDDGLLESFLSVLATTYDEQEVRERLSPTFVHGLHALQSARSATLHARRSCSSDNIYDTLASRQYIWWSGGAGRDSDRQGLRVSLWPKSHFTTRCTRRPGANAMLSSLPRDAAWCSRCLHSQWTGFQWAWVGGTIANRRTRHRQSEVSRFKID